MPRSLPDAHQPVVVLAHQGDGSEGAEGDEQNQPSSSSGPSPRGHRGRAAAGARERRHEPVLREMEDDQHGGVQVRTGGSRGRASEAALPVRLPSTLNIDSVGCVHSAPSPPPHRKHHAHTVLDSSTHLARRVSAGMRPGKCRTGTVITPMSSWMRTGHQQRDLQPQQARGQLQQQRWRRL